MYGMGVALLNPKKQPSVETDPYFSNVVLLAHMDAAVGSSVIDDIKGHVFSATGSASIVTDAGAFSGKSLALSGAYVSAPYSSDWVFTGDFTVEFRCNIVSHNGYGGLVNCASSIFLWTGWQLLFNSTSDNILVELDRTGASMVSSSTMSASTYHSVMLSRSGSTVRLFIDGIIVATTTFSGTLDSAGYPLLIGTERTIAVFSTGNFEEVRITNGICRETANYTPRTTPFPNS